MESQNPQHLIAMKIWRRSDDSFFIWTIDLDQKVKSPPFLICSNYSSMWPSSTARCWIESKICFNSKFSTTTSLCNSIYIDLAWTTNLMHSSFLALSKFSSSDCLKSKSATSCKLHCNISKSELSKVSLAMVVISSSNLQILKKKR